MFILWRKMCCHTFCASNVLLFCILTKVAWGGQDSLLDQPLRLHCFWTSVLCSSSPDFSTNPAKSV